MAILFRETFAMTTATGTSGQVAKETCKNFSVGVVRGSLPFYTFPPKVVIEGVY
uniref:Uncharacterized protein n=1 Tax=Amphimedon queenslandica TaxID=400682 RepID=A0A1X7UPF4_AMPQE